MATIPGRIPLDPHKPPSVGLIRYVYISDVMGESDDDRITVRARMDQRGRITIPEDDRILLEVNDLGENEKAILEMETVLLRVVGSDD